MRFLFGLFGGAVTAVLVVGAVLVGMSLLGAPRPSCADGVVATSRAASDSFNTKWTAFDRTLSSGQATTVTLTEEELTSRGAGYLLEKDIPARDLQVHLCQGQGKGQAAMSMEVLGRQIELVATGHLELGTGSPRIVIDSLQLGQVPEQVAALATTRLVEAANIQITSAIREITTTSSAATLKGQR